MLTVKEISKSAVEFEQTVESVAAIEAVIQSHDAWSYQTLTELLGQDSIRLIIATASTDNEIVGYCLYQIVFEQAEILRIGTHPKYQRQGIASQLFVALNSELKASKVESLLLEVRADNTPAIALYEQQGFVIIHRRKGYYQQPNQPSIDALIMQLNYYVQ